MRPEIPTRRDRRKLVVGTGGHALGALPLSNPNVAATALQFGAMRLDLGANGATYQFVSTAGQTLDSGFRAVQGLHGHDPGRPRRRT